MYIHLVVTVVVVAVFLVHYHCSSFGYHDPYPYFYYESSRRNNTESPRDMSTVLIEINSLQASLCGVQSVTKQKVIKSMIN